MKSKISFRGIQIKTLEKAYKLSDALTVIEGECGIKVVELSFQYIFVCPWIDLEKLNRNPMDIILRDLLKGFV